MTSVRLTDDERGRVERIDRLVAGGAPSIAELLALLSDPSWSVRRAVVAGLAALGDDAVAPLCAWLQHERSDEHAIAAAVDALATSLGATITAACIALLADADPAVASDAAQILGRRRATEATPMLARAVDHADDNVAVAAIEALGAINGGRAVDALIAVLGRDRFFRTFPALQVLARTNDPRTIAPIGALLADETYRFEAARALGRAGFAQAILPLASLLDGGDEGAVTLVAFALADLLAGTTSSGALDHVVATMRSVVGSSRARFVAALEHADAAERAAIASVLGRIGDASALPALVQLLDDPGTHAAASAAIQHIGQDHDEAAFATLASGEPVAREALLSSVRSARAAPGVRAMLSDEDPEIRARACEALARIGDTASVPALFAALGDPSPRVAHAATAAIHSLGVADTAARAIAAVRTGSPAVRRHALRIIAYMGFETAFDTVVLAATDSDPRIAELAVAAFALLADDRVDGVLAELARDAREGVRAATMRVVAQRAHPTAWRQLGEGLRDEASWVRYYAVQGLGRLGEVTALALVVACLADPAPHVRVAAIEALGHFDDLVAWQALCSVIASPDLDERRAALASMATSGHERALAFLLDGAEAPDIATRLIALSGLARRPEPEALAVLVAAAVGEPPVGDAALSLLGDRDDAAAATALVDIAIASRLDHPAQRTLSHPGVARLAAITARLPAIDDAGAARLIGALARLRDIPAVKAALALDNPAVRRAAARALIALGDVAMLVRLAIEDPDHEVRKISASAS